MKSDKGQGTYELEYPYHWSHALGTAVFLHMFQRNSDIIGLATWAQTVNVLAPIMTTETGSFVQTVYTPLQAYRQYTEDQHVPIRIDADSLAASVPTVDGVASVSDDGRRVILSLVNLLPDATQTAQITWAGVEVNPPLTLARHVTFTATSLDEANTMEKNVVVEQDRVIPRQAQESYEVDIPSASINFLIFE